MATANTLARYRPQQGGGLRGCDTTAHLPHRHRASIAAAAVRRQVQVRHAPRRWPCRRRLGVIFARKKRGKHVDGTLRLGTEGGRAFPCCSRDHRSVPAAADGRRGMVRFVRGAAPAHRTAETPLSLLQESSQSCSGIGLGARSDAPTRSKRIRGKKLVAGEITMFASGHHRQACSGEWPVAGGRCARCARPDDDLIALANAPIRNSAACKRRVRSRRKRALVVLDQFIVPARRRERSARLPAEPPAPVSARDCGTSEIRCA